MKNGLSPVPEKLFGNEMFELVKEMYPICRSITGNGVRATLRLLQREIPVAVKEVASGTKVFDWTVPKEWNLRDAYVKNSRGQKIIDVQNSNLHLLNYSVPVHQRISLEELKKHLFSIPEHPEWVPYRTSYYNENWGFCLSHNQLQSLEDDVYEVSIDTSLEPGHLTYGEYYVKGRTSDEVLISTHICHPSLCNDNLSGIALSTFLAKYLSDQDLKYSYRFLFVPGTIGSITWLSKNEANLSAVKHGIVAACVGDAGQFTYKKSRQGDCEIDRAVAKVLADSNRAFEIQDFFPYGYDERQYCSPGINLPMGCLMRTPHGRYPEYHTSADNLSLVSSQNLEETFAIYHSVFYLLENNRTYVNQNPKCEPQLGSRGLYAKIGGDSDAGARQLAMLWILNLSDGTHSLLQIAEKSNIRFDLINTTADLLTAHGLLKEIQFS